MTRKKSGSKSASNGATSTKGKGSTASASPAPVCSMLPSSKPSTSGLIQNDWKDDVIRFYRDECITAWKCFLAASLERHLLSIQIARVGKEFDVTAELFHIGATFQFMEAEKKHLVAVLEHEKEQFFGEKDKEDIRAAERFVSGMRSLDMGYSMQSIQQIDPSASLQHFHSLVAEGTVTSKVIEEDDDLNLSFASSTFSEGSSDFLSARSTCNGWSPRGQNIDEGVLDVKKEESISLGNHKKKKHKSGSKSVEEFQARPELGLPNDALKMKNISSKSPRATNGVKQPSANIVGVESGQNGRDKTGTNATTSSGAADGSSNTKKPKSSAKGVSERSIGSSGLTYPNVGQEKREDVNGNVPENIEPVFLGKPTSSKKPPDQAVIGSALNGQSLETSVVQTSGSLSFNGMPLSSADYLDERAIQIEEDEKFARELSRIMKLENSSGADSKALTLSATGKRNKTEEPRVPTSVSVSNGGGLSNHKDEVGHALENRRVVPPLHMDVRPKKFVKIPSLHKTSLCWNYEENRTCPWGDKCIHAHGRAELRARPEWFLRASDHRDKPPTHGTDTHNNQAYTPGHLEPCGDQQCQARLQFYLRKTTICKPWQALKCDYSAAQCNYAHGPADRKPLPKHEMCKRHLAGKCKVTECVYAHSREELRVVKAPPTAPQTRVKVENNNNVAFSKTWSPLGRETSQDRDCIICSETFESALERFPLNCGHDCFHRKCIEQWLEVDMTCPYCRAVVDLTNTFKMPHGARAKEYPRLA